jgi:hypothetical protein
MTNDDFSVYAETVQKDELTDGLRSSAYYSAKNRYK